jgi:hypothetical protein
MDKSTDGAFISILILTVISAFFTFLFGVIGVLIGGYWQQYNAVQLEQKKTSSNCAGRPIQSFLKVKLL